MHCIWFRWLAQKNPTNDFKFKNRLFWATSLVRSSNKEKNVYSGYGITFYDAGFWSFDNDTAINVVIFGVDNSSSSLAENGKNSLLVLIEGPIFRINGSFGSPEKKFSVSFSKANSYLFVNGKEIF